MEVLMRFRNAFILLIFTLFTLSNALGMTENDAKLAIQEFFQDGHPEKGINLAGCG